MKLLLFEGTEDEEEWADVDGEPSLTSNFSEVVLTSSCQIPCLTRVRRIHNLLRPRL